jgi:pimeloyl-ACP methyl ester carboxylesterase
VSLEKLRYWTIVLLVLSAVAFFGLHALVRKAMFAPTHHRQDNGLAHWVLDGRLIGYSREVVDPQNVWLMLHGNGGQAADRTYVLPGFDARDAVFILEYPGYGQRPGKLSRSSFDAAAREAYESLRGRFPHKPVCIATESLGSGAGSTLARLPRPPDKFVFIVPFDDVKSLASRHAGWLPTGLLLSGSWDNLESMAGYRGPVEIFGAQGDEIIPVQHARRLAAGVPQAQFHQIPGGHNEWSEQREVRIRNP